MNITEDICLIILKLSGGDSGIGSETRLIGAQGVLDSMRLVELCLALEDLAAERGFEFDWTSDGAMSRSGGMFRTVGSLAAEFAAQEAAVR